MLRFTHRLLALVCALGGLITISSANTTEAKAEIDTQTVTAILEHNAPGTPVPPPPPGQDADSNGLHDLWEVQHFGQIGIDPSGDADGDGFTNLQEFLAETDPLNPHPGWVFFALPATMAPVAVSPDGIGLLHDSSHYWRWQNGTLAQLGEYYSWQQFEPGQFRNTTAVLNRRGDVAVRQEISSNEQPHPNGVDWSLDTSSVTTTVYPINGDLPWSYSAPSFTAKSDFIDAEVQDAQGNFVRWPKTYYESNELKFIALGEDGALWGNRIAGKFTETYGSGTRAEHYEYFYYELARIAPRGGSSNAIHDDVAEFFGLDASGRPIGTAYVSFEGPETTGFVGMEMVPYLPSAQSFGGRVISYNNGTQSLHETDGTEKPLPSNYYRYYFDSQERVNIWEYDSTIGAFRSSLLTPTGEGGNWQRIAYIPLPMPNGWSSTHQIAPGTEATQLGMASINGAAAQPFIAILNPARLLVDANRDGEIKLLSEDLSDLTIPEKPYRFWINDDDDNGGDINGDDTPGAAAPDGQQIKVQGTRDLVDFFPVFLDLKQLLTVLPLGAETKYKFKNADDGLRFVYTDLSRADAFKYLKDSATGNSLKEADAHWVTAAGYELDTAWLGQVKDADKGVILVEGRSVTDKPLGLSVEKADGTMIAEVKLELKIVPVETMFRHLNLHDRNLAGLVGTKEDSAQPEAMDDPTGFPDNPNSDSRWLIFVHGFNVSGQKSRGWNAEMFKRTYWSGNKSRFVGVSWFGNPDPGSLGLPADYHLSMRNAMVTAPVLAQEINALPGSAATKTMFAHSLGCGVISSAIADHGMTGGKVCFVDAALARECFDGRDPDSFTSENDGMTPAVWKPYSPRLYAANWFARFDPATDARGQLTWTNRFSGASSVVYHFYSSTEDVLAEYAGELPSTLGGIAWDSGLHGSFGWVYQEKGKGNRQNYGLGGPPLTHLGSYYGGWGMNIKDPVLSGDTPYWKWVNTDSFIGRMIKTPTEIGTVSDSVLRRHPVFEPGWGVVRNQEHQENPVSNVSPVDGAPSWIYDLYLGTAGNTLASDAINRAQLLAEAIPSLTWCMGSHFTSRFGDTRNFNLPSLVNQTNWPRGRPDGVTPEWRHSDMREVAYLYQYGVFDKIVELSKL